MLSEVLEIYLKNYCNCTFYFKRLSKDSFVKESSSLERIREAINGKYNYDY